MRLTRPCLGLLAAVLLAALGVSLDRSAPVVAAATGARSIRSLLSQRVRETQLSQSGTGCIKTIFNKVRD